MFMCERMSACDCSIVLKLACNHHTPTPHTHHAYHTHTRSFQLSRVVQMRNLANEHWPFMKSGPKTATPCMHLPQLCPKRWRRVWSCNFDTLSSHLRQDLSEHPPFSHSTWQHWLDASAVVETYERSMLWFWPAPSPPACPRMVATLPQGNNPWGRQLTVSAFDKVSHGP